MVSLWVLENAWCWQAHQKPITNFKNHSLKKGHSLRTASMCWSPPSAGSKKNAGKHQPPKGDVIWGLGVISYNDFFMGHHERSPPPMTLILQSKATSCPSRCHPCQGEIIIEDWLWLSWTGFFWGGKGTQRWGKWKGELFWVCFHFWEIDVFWNYFWHLFLLSCSFPPQRWSEAWQEKLPTQEQEQQGKWAQGSLSSNHWSCSTPQGIY